MIGRADIEGSKSNVATNAWLPQASYPCGNFSDTSSWTAFKRKGSIGHVFTVCIHTENHNQASISPFGHHGISVLVEPTLGHLRYNLTDVPPQPNSLADGVLHTSIVHMYSVRMQRIFRVRMHIANATQFQLLYCCQLVAMSQVLVNVQHRFTIFAIILIIKLFAAYCNVVSENMQYETCILYAFGSAFKQAPLPFCNDKLLLCHCIGGH